MVDGARGRRPNSEWDLGRFRSSDWSDIAAAVQQTSPDLIYKRMPFVLHRNNQDTGGGSDGARGRHVAAVAPAGAVTIKWCPWPF